MFNDTQAKIREFCKDAYLDWGVSYVLVGGDDEWIPARHMRYEYESDVEMPSKPTDILYAINPDGTKKLGFKTGDWIHSSPAIAADGTVYVGSDDGCLYATYPNGDYEMEV